MPHSATWDETAPPNSQAVSLGAQRIREFKRDVRERMALDHVWNVSTTTDGWHKQITMSEVADPASPAADYAIVYLKDVAGTTHLFMKDSAGTVRQLSGALSGSVAWANITGVPVLVSGLGALADPGFNAYLKWNDGTNLLEFSASPLATEVDYSGYVGSDGTTGNVLPSGWSCSKTATGKYEVTHNLAVADGTRLTGIAIPYAAVSNTCRVESGGVSTANKIVWQFYTSSSGAAVDSAFMFHCKKN
jgi:hypothetical protein